MKKKEKVENKVQVEEQKSTEDLAKDIMQETSLEEVKEEPIIPETKNDSSMPLKDKKDEKKQEKKKLNTRAIARIAIFGAISTLLYVVPIFQIPFFGFLSFHFDDVPALIASFAYGPWTAFFITLIKIIIKLPFTSTVCVGELSDLIYSLAFIMPAALIYQKMRSVKGVTLGLFVGFAVELIFAGVLNAYVMLDFYSFLFGAPKEALLAPFAPLGVHNLASYIFFAIIPFNIIKNVIITLLTLVVYKPLHNLIVKKNW